MFSYEPLEKKIEEKVITYEKVGELLGIREVGAKVRLKCGYHITQDELDKLCSYLKCQPNEIMIWKEGVQPCGDTDVTVNWPRLTTLVGVRGRSMNWLSRRCGLNTSTLAQAKSRNSKIKKYIIDIIVDALDLDINEIVIKD